jgi:GNAT superfamily N-acetyltransferase
MNVEKAGVDDIDVLVKLRLDYLCEDHGSLSEDDRTVIRRDLPGYFQAHLAKDLFVYVIREDHVIVSCAFLLIIEKPMSPSFINGKSGIVLNVYTCPSARRKGYAGAVMRTMISDAKEKNLSVIELKSTEDGYRLYRSVGFTDDCSKYHMMKWKNR